MEVLGYKIFNNNFTNRYGIKFKVGKIYIAQGEIKFGNNGNGFHMCKNIEDTFRYFDALNKDVKICEVKGSGEIDESFDDYNEYYDIYSVEKLEILKLLTRKEIIDIGYNLNELRAERFVSGFRLTKEEIEKFKEKFYNSQRVLDTIEYYQNKKYDIHKKGVKVYGKYNNKGSKRK